MVQLILLPPHHLLLQFISCHDTRLFHKMGNQAHCLHSVLPPLPCSASLQTRPKGHPYDLPRYKYDLSRKSFVLRCLYNFVWFYVFWLYDFICALHIRLICVQLKRYIYNDAQTVHTCQTYQGVNHDPRLIFEARLVFKARPLLIQLRQTPGLYSNPSLYLRPGL